MPGPLPNAQKRRRNQPATATRSLPAQGRTDPPPECPYDLGAAGAKWWAWAWKLPQATRWDAGSLYFVGRRAQLEDDMAALEFDVDIAPDDLFADGDFEARRCVEWALSTLRRVAGNRTTLAKEVRELDNRLGLNPKALAELRWAIDESEPSPGGKSSSEVRKLRAV